LGVTPVMNKLTLVFINHLKSGGAKIKKIAHGLLFSTTTTTTTSIHATDPLLVPTTPYYAHLYPLLPRARGALQDLDRTPQEPGHYDNYHDRHPRNGPLSRRRPTTRTFTPFYFAQEEHCKTWTAPRRSPDTTTTTTTGIHATVQLLVSTGCAPVPEHHCTSVRR
jgi:hypothetical protein